MFVELFEVLAEAVTIRDSTGIIYANRAALAHLGIESLEQLRGRSGPSIMSDYLIEDEHGLPITYDDVPGRRLMRGQTVKPMLLRSVHVASGKLRWIVLRTSAIRDPNGSIIGAITMIEDVTAVKTAELRTRVLAESGRILAFSLDYPETLRNVARIAVPALADFCGLDLLDDRGQLQRVAAVHRDPARAELARRLAQLPPRAVESEHPAARVLRSGRSELFREITDGQLADVARDGRHMQLLGGLNLRSLAIVALQVPGRVIGLLTLATDESRRHLQHDDVELAEQLARRAAVAVENARLHTRLAGVAETLQRSLLPGALPDVPGWEIASLYRPAQTELRIDVGGDFYEFFERDGTWFAIIGDVTGKGVTAASVSALMRHGARVASRAEPAPSAILGRLDEVLAQTPEGTLCTALCLCLHRDHVVISSAGHPTGILVGRDGELREAPSCPGPLLGAFPDADWQEETVPVSDGELLVLYTDGVTEAPGAEERFGLARLQRLLVDHAGESPSAVLGHVDDELGAFVDGPPRDDVAALALRRSTFP